jgi:hypothetical protein
MRFRQFITFASIVPLACCLMATGARACFWTVASPSGGFCDGCQYVASIVLSRNETCERYSVTPQRSAIVIALIDSRIDVRAKHGIAGANGNMVAYEPDKDYVGPDEFVKEVVFRQNDKLGRFKVRYLITVK